ncbi:response regulator transcription factor [Pseudalkalibacillus caeni]|uniref:Response regulator transcription factor n=1 Tax=Exobacillus caeni TaxID=2574798 RepID=A0A5R9F0J9_9BACL|nr:response regulator transcription factor [Pseudalkalibacillus caeni]TLS36219.1 response regulator transcription factor [Pseudalkalibacillus caeni]
MIVEKVEDYINSAKQIKDPIRRIEKLMVGGVTLFPFQRASIFTYSPLTNVGEGVLFIEGSKVKSFHEVREDVRSIPHVYSALVKNKSQFIVINNSTFSFPEKYVNMFSLSSLLVIPLSHQDVSIGCVFIDRFNGQIDRKLIRQLENYFQHLTESIFKVTKQHEDFLHFSERQCDILQLLSNGCSTKEIAGRLEISEFTVRDYLTAISRKLDARNRTEAVAIALRKGIIQ